MQGKISEFNNLLSYLCLAVSVLISWFLTQEGVSSNNLFLQKVYSVKIQYERTAQARQCQTVLILWLD